MYMFGTLKGGGSAAAIRLIAEEVGSKGVVSNLISAKLLIKYQFISAQPPLKYATTTTTTAATMETKKLFNAHKIFAKLAKPLG